MHGEYSSKFGRDFALDLVQTTMIVIFVVSSRLTFCLSSDERILHYNSWLISEWVNSIYSNFIKPCNNDVTRDATDHRDESNHTHLINCGFFIRFTVWTWKQKQNEMKTRLSL